MMDLMARKCEGSWRCFWHGWLLCSVGVTRSTLLLATSFTWNLTFFTQSASSWRSSSGSMDMMLPMHFCEWSRNLPSMGILRLDLTILTCGNLMDCTLPVNYPPLEAQRSCQILLCPSQDALLICAGKRAKQQKRCNLFGYSWKWYILGGSCQVSYQLYSMNTSTIYTDKLSPRIKIILEPLAIAANITQAPHTRHVLLTLGNLYCIYSTLEFDVEVCTAILASLKKWWVKADQEVFILAVFLNPYIHHWCFSRWHLQMQTCTIWLHEF